MPNYAISYVSGAITRDALAHRRGGERRTGRPRNTRSFAAACGSLPTGVSITTSRAQL